MIARFGGDVVNKGYHVTTTIDSPLQTAANLAVRDGLLLCRRPRRAPARHVRPVRPAAGDRRQHRRRRQRHRGAGQPQRDRAASRRRQVDQQDPGQAGAARRHRARARRRQGR
ncbi:hypothetical protein G6F50_017358 [Rhizopus delemar]|uniref:Uncharacterized protein n=1 Tax=Rhizopus delemar TaxID=936053 RepID=A0A9P7C0P5_9FUNG|nr:hypothetical protein G6F50_017358 [Rhizopus delemar]